MITTICLNPSFDRSVEMDTLQLGKVNRIRALREDMGGKGINVAVVAQRLGLDVQCIGVMGESGADELSAMMDREGLKHQFLKIPGRVRTNLKLVIRDEKGITELNETGTRLEESDLRSFFDLAREKTADVTTLVLDRRCYPLFAFSSAAEAHLSSGQTFAIVRFEKGARIVDGMLGNIDEMTLKPGTARPGLMTILNRAWIGQPVRIRLDIDSPAAQELQFSGVSFSAVKQLNEGRAWYEIVVGQAETNYQFTVSSESVLLYGFEIIPLSSRAE